ncbi:MAG: nucleoside transporter C-terminal domain-containing protein [Pseudomonadota bacterium]|jgi:CNT family concentrative nucleoside transporter
MHLELRDLQASLGIVVFIALAVPCSANRHHIRWGRVAVAVVLQFAICALLLRVPPIAQALGLLNAGVAALGEATREGTAFVFGYLGGGPAPFAVTESANSFVLGFQSLALIIVISALSAVLWHWRILPAVIGAIAVVFRKALGTGGAAGFAVSANVFLGQVEAPLVVKPYLATMSRYELMLLMTAGMSMIAGSVMVLYSIVLAGQMQNVPAHLLTKSLMSIPASILFAHIMVPDAGDPSPIVAPRPYGGTIDALTRGTADGLLIWLNVLAMLLVLVALVALANKGLSAAPLVAGTPLSLERVAGWGFTPLAWLMGLDWHHAVITGHFLGVKTVLNEFIAYLRLAAAGPDVLDPRSRLVTVYALCGFANFASMGIQVTGIAAMAPERRADLVALAPRALWAATLASLMTGAIVGIVGL